MIVGYLVYDTYWAGNLERMQARDGKEYIVRGDAADKKAAADLLADIREGLEKIVAHLEKTAPDDPRVRQLSKNFDGAAIQEGRASNKYTSYSVSKGEKIVFCLRNKETGELVDKNTMIFVGIHELAHIATVDVGHTDGFWTNMRWLLDEAINIGVYFKQDFKRNPVKYCGLTITSSPLD